MAINILMAVYIAIALGIGTYLLMHRNQPFLVFHPEENPNLSRIVLVGGIAFILVGIASLGALFSGNGTIISFTLLAGIVVVLAFELILVTFFPQSKR